MKIVITELNWPIGQKLLQDKGWHVVYRPDLWKDRKALRAELAGADAVIVRNQTRVDAEMMDWAPGLKVIGRLGVGLDNIDLDAAAEREIAVVYGKNANAASVAEYVIAAIFSSCRLLKEAGEDVKRGRWDRKTFTGTELAGKTLGLAGVGEIGHRVAVRARTLGMQTIGYDPFVSPYDFPVSETGIRMVALDELIAASDFISLHVPLTPATRNLIGNEALSRMKPSAYLINTSRGGIIDEEALYRALAEKRIAGAVLDVLEKEPPAADHPLLGLDNCLITPHIAGLTEESQVRTAEMVSREVIGELEGRPSLCRVRTRK